MAWDNETDEIMNNVTVNYVQGTGYFSCNALIVVSDVLANAIILQQIPIEAGWYIFSTYLEPDNMNISSVNMIGDSGLAKCMIIVEVRDTKQLNRLKSKLKTISRIYKIERQ